MNMKSSSIHNRSKLETTQISCNRWTIKQTGYSRGMECYLSVKKNGLCMRATTWMDLKKTTLSEISHLSLLNM